MKIYLLVIRLFVVSGFFVLTVLASCSVTNSGSGSSGGNAGNSRSNGNGSSSTGGKSIVIKFH